jgi:hypothetical protein
MDSCSPATSPHHIEELGATKLRLRECEAALSTATTEASDLKHALNKLQSEQLSRPAVIAPPAVVADKVQQSDAETAKALARLRDELKLGWIRY